MPLLSDDIVELDETFEVQAELFYFDQSALIGVGETATGTILNDQSTTITIVDATVLEGDDGTSLMEFTLQLGQPVDVPIAVTVATQDGTAVAGIDYQAINETVFVGGNGELTQTIRVPVLGNEILETDRSFSLGLSLIHISEPTRPY